MPPSRERADAGVLAAGLKPEAVSCSRSISSRKIFVSVATAAGRSASMPRNRFGTEITHCRTGTGGMTRSARWAVVWAMCRPLQDGQTPRPLQENATTNPVRHVMETGWAKPKQRSPHSR